MSEADTPDTNGTETETHGSRGFRSEEAFRIGLDIYDLADTLQLHHVDGLLAAVTDLAKLREAADEWLTWTIMDARRAGKTWEAIGEALGVTRQAAQQRYGRPIGE